MSDEADAQASLWKRIGFEGDDGAIAGVEASGADKGEADAEGSQT